jgi:histidinol-phosphate aminotransferase
MYENITKKFGNKCHILEHEDDYTLNLSKAINAKNSVLILTNPSSLTGMSISIKEIDDFLSEYQGLLIIDETYTMFSGETAINLIKKYNNVIITRSISISHSLPGVRLSFIISNEETIKKINKVKTPYNISTLAEIIAIEALRDTKNTFNNTVHIINMRKELISNLSKLGFIVMPSKSNFVLAKSVSIPSFELFKYLEKENIFIRYFEESTLKDWLRISVGSEKDNSILISKIKYFIKSYQDK